MTRKWDLCQKSRHPVTKITGIRALDCDGYRPAAQQPHWTARNRNMAEDLGTGRILVPAACIAERILPVALRTGSFSPVIAKKSAWDSIPRWAAETLQNCGNLLPQVVG